MMMKNIASSSNLALPMSIVDNPSHFEWRFVLSIKAHYVYLGLPSHLGKNGSKCSGGWQGYLVT